MTYVSNNLDLLVLHLIEDVCISEGLQELRAGFHLLLEELHKLVELCASLLKVLGELLSSCFVCDMQRENS